MTTDAVAFIHDPATATPPEDVAALLTISLWDALGVAAAGSDTAMARAACDAADAAFRAAEAPSRMLFDGRPVSAVGAALAGAATVDAIDAHDGHSGVKGHAGSAVIPAAFAEIDRAARPIDGRALLGALTVGYEIGYRAGLALHATTADYHTSGAWGAVGAAALAARLRGLDAEQTRHALGVAEYWGPRSQMMRCIDHPSNLRDGVSWGAPSGIAAVEMAARGFTGAPALTVESAEAAPHWATLGAAWETRNTHYKRWPVCRWAHPAIDGALDLMAAHHVTPEAVAAVEIRTFAYAVRLAGQAPATEDEIAYGVAFPTAAAILRGGLGRAELSPAALNDPAIRRLAAATTVIEDPKLTEKSVGKRWAAVTLRLDDGRVLTGPERAARGDPDDPLSAAELRDKYAALAVPALGDARAAEIAALSAELPALAASDVARLRDLVLAAP